ncbi:unnamed protein product [Polarella glacialis]|uniref:Uncharacterized protein n=1 Tax=Polarella glacialis TaxID=89957 RepID=A0A813G8C6_POLGL|nr:unnamed protein product [Polarella glacialis]
MSQPSDQQGVAQEQPARTKSQDALIAKSAPYDLSADSTSPEARERAKASQYDRTSSTHQCCWGGFASWELTPQDYMRKRSWWPSLSVSRPPELRRKRSRRQSRLRPGLPQEQWTFEGTAGQQQQVLLAMAGSDDCC